jgi:hypothetical protein
MEEDAMPQPHAFLAAMLVPAVALSQPATKIAIAPGETLTLRVTGDGSATVEGRTPAGPLTGLETEFMRQATAAAIVPGVASQPPLPGRSMTPPPPVAPGLLRITFRSVPPPLAKGANGDMMLGIENGYDGALRYKAVMRRGGRSQPTDVCIIIPLKRGYEQWPYLFDGIELSDFHIIPWHEGDAVSCE